MAAPDSGQTVPGVASKSSLRPGTAPWSPNLSTANKQAGGTMEGEP